MNGGTVEVVAGINLPMLIKLAERARRGDASARRSSHAQDAGRKYINVASPRPDREMSPMDLRRRLPAGARSRTARSSASCRSSIARACTPAPPPNSSRWSSNSMPTSPSPAAARPSAALDHGPPDAGGRARAPRSRSPPPVRAATPRTASTRDRRPFRRESRSVAATPVDCRSCSDIKISLYL